MSIKERYLLFLFPFYCCTCCSIWLHNSGTSRRETWYFVIKHPHKLQKNKQTSHWASSLHKVHPNLTGRDSSVSSFKAASSGSPSYGPFPFPTLSSPRLWVLPIVYFPPGGTSGKESSCQCRRHKRRGFNPWVRKIPRSRNWQPTPVFLPGKFHGQNSLVGYSPWSQKESDTTEHKWGQL